MHQDDNHDNDKLHITFCKRVLNVMCILLNVIFLLVVLMNTRMRYVYVVGFVSINNSFPAGSIWILYVQYNMTDSDLQYDYTI